MIYEDQFITKRLQQKGIESGGSQLKSLPFPEDHHVIERIEDIDLGGLNLTCIPVQGHSPGNISIFVPEKKTLFVSDSLGFHYPGRGFCPLFLTGYADFMEAVKHMESLEPEIIALGHQGVIINDVENAFMESQAAANNMLEIVKHSRETDEKIAQMFFEKYYVDEFNLYSEENIMNCCRLLVRRSRETLREIIP
ncbi:MAG: MBL fold metallo-hydrolase [Bacteroidetes bacterium]|nr:MBL fold metallo-hydrolase [Bacteroidota bacterium]